MAVTKEVAGREKNLIIKRNGSSMFCEITWEGGGELPSMLTGLFTSEKEAEQAIARWEEYKRTRNKTTKAA